MKDSEWSGLFKIPKEEVIKQLRLELGKRNSYIQELEHRLKKQKSLFEGKNTRLAHIEHLKNENENLRNRLDSCTKRILKFNKENELLQKQLLKQIK